jgi:hypothetical protein
LVGDIFHIFVVHFRFVWKFMSIHFIVVATFDKSFQSSFNLSSVCFKSRNTTIRTENTEIEKEKLISFLFNMCLSVSVSVSFTNQNKHNLRRLRLRERIQDVDWDFCSNTLSSIVQVSLDSLQESLVSILGLCRYVCYQNKNQKYDVSVLILSLLFSIYSK